MPSRPAIALLAAATLPTQAPDMQLFWGDIHLHTSYSFDLDLFGTFEATTDTVYRFARGLTVSARRRRRDRDSYRRVEVIDIHA